MGGGGGGGRKDIGSPPPPPRSLFHALWRGERTNEGGRKRGEIDMTKERSYTAREKEEEALLLLPSKQCLLAWLLVVRVYVCMLVGTVACTALHCHTDYSTLECSQPKSKEKAAAPDRSH